MSQDFGNEKKRPRPESPEEDEAADQPEVVEFDMRQAIVYKKLPWGVWLSEKLCGGGVCSLNPSLGYKLLILILTFCCYTSYHLSRKPTSVVKVALCPECAKCNVSNNTGWEPFDSGRGETLLGVLDYSWLFAYAISMYFSGFLSDRLNLRYFLTVGMLGSGLSVCLLGVAYFADIHKLYYFILVQVFGGIMQSTGWPSVVAVMSHWFGKHNRGLIMGIWNSHTSVGNILGTVIPSFWADCDEDDTGGDPWGWSFLIPGFIIIAVGIATFFFLVTDPTHVGVPPPQQHLREDLEDAQKVRESSPLRGNGLGNGVMPYSSNGPIDEGRDIRYGSTNYEEPPELPYGTNSDQDSLINSYYTKEKEKPQAINFFRALTIPGVVEYSIALFFNKLVSYTFLFWLPLYVKNKLPQLSGPQSDWLSTAFDVGGILGGIIAGVVSDRLNARAITCVSMLVLAVPSLFILESVSVDLPVFIVLLVVNGALVNGPYGMITTAVSSDLGTHPSLKASTNAKATVTAIIDGTGSLGAAFGPLLVGLINNHTDNWNASFYLLMSACAVSALFLSRLVGYELIKLYQRKLKHCPCCRSSSPSL